VFEVLETFTTAEAGSDQLRAIRDLLDAAFGGEFSDEDWAHTLGGRHVVISEAGVPVSHGVYERLGWERWRGPTYVRRGADLVRTEDEDDGVMVLRFGPSAGLDLTAPIACTERGGDDW
jgi:hypothetical protein